MNVGAADKTKGAGEKVEKHELSLGRIKTGELLDLFYLYET